MKKRTLRICALFLSVAMILSACGSKPAQEETTAKTEAETSTQEEAVQETESAYPEYLNLDSAYPIVKDEYADDISLTVAILMQDNAGEWEDLWVNKYFQEKYNVNLEVEYLSFANAEEKTNLMLSSNDLPDMLINLGITSSEIMKYGAGEGIFLQLDQYMNETLTPNILKYLTGEAKSICTALDGHVYTLPMVNNQLDSGNFKRIFINRQWLDDLGLEMPKTLDEFVDTMYAIKEADPAGVGSDNLYPFGSGDKRGFGNAWYILNALGYINASSIAAEGYGMEPCLRDGEAVIPVYDMEVYQEYLKIMNQFYTDGIINPTFFTIEETEMNAQMVEGKTAMYHNAPYLSGITNTEDWEALYPLTSDWQTEPETGSPSYAVAGNFLVSAETEYPELCLRFADLFYNNETDASYALYSAGVVEGYVEREYIEETGKFTFDASKFPAEMSAWAYMCEYLIGNQWQFGSYMTSEAIEKWAAEQGHPEYKEEDGNFTGEKAWRNTIVTNMEPYATDGFPLSYYVTDETALRMEELKTLITPYVEEQVALFITGRRPLSETGDFVKEMEELGMEELLSIYQEIYANY